MSERMGNLVVFNQIPLRDEVGPHAGFQGELVLAHIFLLKTYPRSSGLSDQ